jgi:hypothetical protein
MACGRGDQAIEQVGVFDLIASAERLDHALDVAAALTSVLDEVEIFVASCIPAFRTRHKRIGLPQG